MLEFVQYTLLITAFIYVLFEINPRFSDTCFDIAKRLFIGVFCIVASYNIDYLALYSHGVQFLVLLFSTLHMIYSVKLLFGGGNVRTIP